MQQRSVSIAVTGTVQGVFFRHHTQLKAQELGLKGFVQNEPDGSVSICAEGDAQAVNILIEWARRGPDSARVSGVSVEDAPHGGYDTFDVRQ